MGDCYICGEETEKGKKNFALGEWIYLCSRACDDEYDPYEAESVKPTITNYRIDGEQMKITVDYQGMPYSGILDGGYWDAESFEAPKGQLFTPYKNTTSDETINMRINATDMRNYDNLPQRSRRTVLVTNMKDGKRYYVRRADCGAGCYCAAEVVKVMDAESFDAEKKGYQCYRCGKYYDTNKEAKECAKDDILFDRDAESFDADWRHRDWLNDSENKIYVELFNTIGSGAIMGIAEEFESNRGINSYDDAIKWLRRYTKTNQSPIKLYEPKYAKVLWKHSLGYNNAYRAESFDADWTNAPYGSWDEAWSDQVAFTQRKGYFRPRNLALAGLAYWVAMRLRK